MNNFVDLINIDFSIFENENEWKIDRYESKFEKKKHKKINTINTIQHILIVF